MYIYIYIYICYQILSICSQILSICCITMVLIYIYIYIYTYVYIYIYCFKYIYIYCINLWDEIFPNGNGQSKSITIKSGRGNALASLRENQKQPGTPQKKKKMMCLPTNFKYTYRYSSRYLQQKYNLQVIPDLLLETA